MSESCLYLHWIGLWLCSSSTQSNHTKSCLKLVLDGPTLSWIWFERQVDDCCVHICLSIVHSVPVPWKTAIVSWTIHNWISVHSQSTLYYTCVHCLPLSFEVSASSAYSDAVLVILFLIDKVINETLVCLDVSMCSWCCCVYRAGRTTQFLVVMVTGNGSHLWFVVIALKCEENWDQEGRHVQKDTG